MSVITVCSIFAITILQNFHNAEAISARVHPEDFQTVAGSTVTVSCAVDDIGTHSIYWYRHSTQSYLTKNSKVFHQAGSLKSFWKRLSVVGDTRRGEFNLRIRNVTFEDADRYSCVFFQGSRYVTESKAGELKVYEAPAEGYPKCNMIPNTGVGPGTRVTIKCLSKRGTGAPNSRLDWHRWFEMLPGSFIQGNDPQANYATELSAQDNGAVFTCVETSPVLDVPRTCNVTPFLIPTNVTIIAIQGGHTTKGRSNYSYIEAGHEVLLKCKAEAIPSVTNYTWFVTGEPVKESKKYSIESNGAHLRIKDVQMIDNGTYIECKAWNSVLIEGSGETFLEVETRTRSAQTAGSRPFAPSNIGYIIGPTLALIILISIAIFVVLRLRNKKLAIRRGSEPDLPEPPKPKERIRPSVQVKPFNAEPDVIVTGVESNPDPAETEPLTGVTICSTPHAAIVEHLRENNPSEEPNVPHDTRTDKTASRVLMVGRLSSVTSDTTDSKEQDNTDADNQLYSKPLKKGRKKKDIRRASGIKKSEISFPISVSSETDSIYMNCPTGSVHV